MTGYIIYKPNKPIFSKVVFLATVFVKVSGVLYSLPYFLVTELSLNMEFTLVWLSMLAKKPQRFSRLTHCPPALKLQVCKATCGDKSQVLMLAQCSNPLGHCSIPTYISILFLINYLTENAFFFCRSGMSEFLFPITFPSLCGLKNYTEK